MTKISVAQFANSLKMPVADLLEQLHKAGVAKTKANDLLTEQNKTQLLNYLRLSKIKINMAQAEATKKLSHIQRDPPVSGQQKAGISDHAEPVEVSSARADLERAKRAVNSARAELDHAVRKQNAAQNSLKKLLEQHGLIATKRKIIANKPLVSIPKPLRKIEEIPSHLGTGKMFGMGKPVPPADKAIREAQEVIQEGHVRAEPQKKPKPKPNHKQNYSAPKQAPTPQNTALKDASEQVRLVNDHKMERENDATRDYSQIREGGRFGSHPSHDDYDN